MENENFGFCDCSNKFQICDPKKFLKTAYGLSTHAFTVLLSLSILTYFAIFLLSDFIDIFRFFNLNFFAVTFLNPKTYRYFIFNYDEQVFAYMLLLLIFLIARYSGNRFYFKIYYSLIFLAYLALQIYLTVYQWIFVGFLPIIYFLLSKFFDWYKNLNDAYYVNFKSNLVHVNLYDYHNIFTDNYLIAYVVIFSAIFSFCKRYLGIKIQILFLLTTSICLFFIILLKYYITFNYKNIHKNFLKKETWVTDDSPIEKFNFEKIY